MNGKHKTQGRNEQAWLEQMQAGKRSFQQRQLQQSTQAFQRATQLLPERVEGWINLGSALFEAGQCAAAEVALKQAIALNPGLMVAHMILGDAQRMLGNVSEAMVSYTQAVQLQRAPMALNKLACLLRVKNRFKEAAALYREAIQADPRFSLAQVNYATLQLDLCHYDDAAHQLGALARQTLPPPERDEVSSAYLSLTEYLRLEPAISAMCNKGDLEPLETALRNTPAPILQIDKVPMQGVIGYTLLARQLTPAPAETTIDLPGEWPLIEALFMIPLVNSIDEYGQVKAQIKDIQQPTGELLESVNMVAAIEAARGCRDDMSDPVKAELHLRHWHALACNGLDDILGGHFKYTQNWTASSPTLQRVDPSRASATLRDFTRSIYSDFPPGLMRAALIFMAILDFHPFADGNGRVVLTWINREMEWAGLMPMIFTRESGITGDLGNAIAEVRSNGSDLTPVLRVMSEAQQFARQFCRELTSS